jgi:hypothetical protein
MPRAADNVNLALLIFFMTERDFQRLRQPKTQ